MNRIFFCLLITAFVGCRSAQHYQPLASSETVEAGATNPIGVHDSDDLDAFVDSGSPADAETVAKTETFTQRLEHSVSQPNSEAGEQKKSKTAGAVVTVSFPKTPAAFAVPATEVAAVSLTDVVTSVHQSYPLVSAAFQERAIAAGNQISAWGSFDTKLKASSESGPLGHYETYRNSAGLTKPIYSGGEFFAGYRIGDGDFQPWYKERETNEGGEFKAGVRIPLMRDRDIDQRRADLWRATYDRQIADPIIQAQLVMFAREASLAYWKWVAAGEKYKLGQRWLTLAKDRNQRIIDQKEAGQLALADVQQNEAAIAKRQAKLEAVENELQQAAIKLSLYLRDADGRPLVLTPDQSSGFPLLRDIRPATIDADFPRAQAIRPELQALSLQIQKLEVDYAEAVNMTQAGLDAQLVGSQDVGFPASKKRDKSEFELEAGLFFDMPLERRKGLGKMDAVRAKMMAVSAKRRMVQDKVLAEVQAVHAALQQTREQAERLTESVRLYGLVAENQRVLFLNGESDLLKVAVQEQYALEAAEEQITALYNHFVAFTEYAAVLAIDRPSIDLLPAAMLEE